MNTASLYIMLWAGLVVLFLIAVTVLELALRG